MKRSIIHPFIMVLILCSFSAYGGVITIENLNYDDERFITLSESTIASKNRMINVIRQEKYSPPSIYRYVMQPREDIWTIIAKTSLNIDSITTLNRIDFIGMIGEGKEMFLPDTLGIFFEAESHEIEEIALFYSLPEEQILKIEDPLNPGKSLFYLPEAELPFIERTYLMGVVFHAPIVCIRTSGYGDRTDPFINEMTFHGGVDFSSEEGKLVRASRWGTVIYASLSNGYGNLVILQHELGYYTLYGHLGEFLVEVDENIDTGQAIGKVGATGRTTGPHLHFEIRRYNKQLNPENIPLFLDHN
jgi:murein DD-endopeptidase MepM/ murein hydrolase activator NlpD